MIFGHVAVAASAWAWERERFWPLVLAALGPDLVDKPLYLLGLGPSREAGHGLLFFLVLLFLGWLLRMRPRRLLLLAGLWLSHLVFDLVDLQTLLWPFLGVAPPRPQPSILEKILLFYSGQGDPLLLAFDFFWLAAALAIIVRPRRRAGMAAGVAGLRSVPGRS